MKLFFIVFLYFIVNSCLCQKFELYTGGGVFKVTMKDIQGLQADRLSLLSFKARITDDFPVSINHLVMEPRLNFKNLSIGFHYSFSSTGSRISYGDYSGIINLDVICNSHNFGPFISYPVIKTSKLSFNLFLDVPVVYSEIFFKDYIKVYDEESRERLNVFSGTIGLFPATEIKYNILFMRILLRMGYLYDKDSFLHEQGKKEYYLVNQRNEKVYSNWNGYRIELLLGFKLHR